MQINIESRTPDASSTALSVTRAAAILGISPPVLRKGLNGKTVPDLSMGTIADLAARQILTKVEIDGNSVPVLRPGLAREYSGERRPFSGWMIDRSPAHTTAALDRWWTPPGRELILAAGGFLVAVGSVICAGLELQSSEIHERDGRIRYDAALAGVLRANGDVRIFAESEWGDCMRRTIGSRVLGGDGGHFTRI